MSALVVMLLALAYFEKHGFALLIALFAALCSLAVTAAMVRGAMEPSTGSIRSARGRLSSSIATTAIAVVLQRHRADYQRGGDDAERHRDIAPCPPWRLSS